MSAPKSLNLSTSKPKLLIEKVRSRTRVISILRIFDTYKGKIRVNIDESLYDDRVIINVDPVGDKLPFISIFIEKAVNMVFINAMILYRNYKKEIEVIADKKVYENIVKNVRTLMLKIKHKQH